jgi:para-aminobenzoate synthetase
MTRRRILFLDAYDSFTNNITSLLTTLLDVDVYVLPIDAALSPAEFKDEVARYDAVVCGPGPGRPDWEKDVGLMRQVWELDVPVLGVCLGFQSLIVACGGKVERLSRGLHGMVREVNHRDEDVFDGVGNFEATLYHSLGVTVHEDLDGVRELGLVPLAWVDEERDDGKTEKILMSVRHKSKPFWGLQYHPESVCTDAEGNTVITNWFDVAMKWNETHGRITGGAGGHMARKATRASLSSVVAGRPWNVEIGMPWWKNPRAKQFHKRVIPLPPHVQVPDIVNIVTGHASEHIVLESSNAMLKPPTEAAADVRGRYSIIAFGLQEAVRVEYRSGDDFVTVRLDQTYGERVNRCDRFKLAQRGGIWGFLEEFRSKRRAEPPRGYDTPFMAGFMGYISYEQGLSDIGVKLPEARGHSGSDISLAWVTKSIVVDHQEGLIQLQHHRDDLPMNFGPDQELDEMVRTLEESDVWKRDIFSPSPDPNWRNRPGATCFFKTSMRCPLAPDYQAKVKECQEYIAAGDSYELCLTDQTIITRPRSLSSSVRRQTEAVKRAEAAEPFKKRHRASTRPAPITGILGSGSWQLFCALRTRQPAPFASYLRLGGATLVSASPERFLTYDRAGHVSMRPMKGTVRKSSSVSTLPQAEAILHVPKEEAENLMIVDLVRHDLHGVCGAGNVKVRDLMKVEEYESVFQMITAVEGQLPAEGGYTGLDVLAASLPPGSMTGAPKKRSCEILGKIEGGTERGLYSGVVGYMCASGRGDWSVTIRSMFRWDDEGDDEEEVWRIGAGGAVTILSTAEGEAEEMFTKLAGPLGVFGGLN